MAAAGRANSKVFTPQWVILAIGTNNLTGTPNARANTPEEIVDGIDAIYREIRKRSPESRIILMAILPRGAQPNDPLRQADSEYEPAAGAAFCAAIRP